jgi:hypothetical protein
LDPGAYTAIVRGKGGATGVGLVEMYDLDQGADSQIANISTRGVVETGDNVLIGGFILGGGDVGSNVVLRAIGPSLAQSGITNPLADPTLELHDADGTLVASNDNWQDDPDQAAQLVASTIPPQDPAESAIAAHLPAGAYTAIVRGKNNTTGVGLVEAYNIP